MPRKYARLMVSIWDDDDYKALGLELQGLYSALLAYPLISWCGVIDYIPKRLMKIDPELTEDSLFKKIATLHNHQRIVQLDMDTDELLIRTFIKHDDIMKQPNVAKAMAKAIDRVQSDALRSIVITELGRLYIEQPNLSGWEGLEQVHGDLLEEVYAESERITKGSRKGSANPFEPGVAG